jgi:hypothetical protein
MLRVSALVAGICLTVGVPVSAQPAYEIVLGRPVAVGATYGIVASGTNQEKLVVSRGPEIVDEQASSTRVELAATASVLEIDPLSQPLRLRFAIERSSVERDGETSELLAAGTELVVALANGSKQFTIDGEPAAEDVVASLALIHSLTSSDELNDEMFGTREQKNVGDSWPVAAALAAEWLGRMGFAISAESVHGESTLAGVERRGDAEALRVETRFSIDDLGLSPPPGFVMDESAMTIRIEGTFPTDATRRKLSERFEAQTRLKAVEAAAGDRPRIVMEATGTRTSSASFTEYRQP